MRLPKIICLLFVALLLVGRLSPIAATPGLPAGYDAPATSGTSGTPVPSAALAGKGVRIVPPDELRDEHKTLAIGAPAPDFSLKGIDGNTYTLASFKKA